ncbi:unnamed protein product [Rotaria socialis]
MDINDTDEIRSNGKRVSNLWEHMTKQENGNPQCKICNKLQSRQSGATSGLRVAHRLHLVVCSGFGIWIRKNPTSSSSDTPTTSNIDAISNGDLNNIDSDKEDYTDKIQLNPGSWSLDESSQTSNSLLNKNVHPNVTVNEIFVNDEPGNLSIDITDNWPIDVIEKLDARTGEIAQQDIGVLMKKSRSIVKLTSPPFS